MNSQNPCRKLHAAVCICNLSSQQGKGYRPASLDYTQHSSENNETLLQQDRRQGLTLEVCPLILSEQEGMSTHTSYTQKTQRHTDTKFFINSSKNFCLPRMINNQESDGHLPSTTTIILPLNYNPHKFNCILQSVNTRILYLPM